MYKGCFTAIVTPFLNNKIDTASLFAQACFLKENGVNGIVCCGTTGEGPVLTSEEYSAVTIAVRSAVGLDYPVITGAGSNNTVRAVELSKIVAQAGADAVLSVTPFYNKPSQSGLIAHFTMIADKSPVPVILYNVPGRTGVDMSYETVKILSEHQNIIGLKEANPDQFKMIRLGALSNDNFTILSGDDYTVVPSMSAGAKGVISVVANIMPRLFSSMTEAMLNNQYESALKIQSDLLEIIDAMFIESNPVPVKTALFNMKMISNEFRLPLVEMSQKNKVKLKNIMMKFGLIEKMFKE